MLRDEDLDVVIATAGSGDDVVTTAADAISDLVRDMLAGEPYVITHGSRAEEIRARHEAIEHAHTRMRGARDGRAPGGHPG